VHIFTSVVLNMDGQQIIAATRTLHGYLTAALSIHLALEPCESGRRRFDHALIEAP
jgi:hypothetical protein